MKFHRCAFSHRIIPRSMDITMPDTDVYYTGERLDFLYECENRRILFGASLTVEQTIFRYFEYPLQEIAINQRSEFLSLLSLPRAPRDPYPGHFIPSTVSFFIPPLFCFVHPLLYPPSFYLSSRFHANRQ